MPRFLNKNQRAILAKLKELRRARFRNEWPAEDRCEDELNALLEQEPRPD